MDKLITSGISDPTKLQPLLGPSIEFIQNAYKDAINALCECAVGDNVSGSTVYVLRGGRKTGSVIADGYIFYAGEVYFLTGADTTAYSNIPVVVANNGNGAADPITYSDGTTGNVHNVRAARIADQSTGTGFSDYANVVFLQPLPVTVGGGGTAPAFQNSWAYGSQLVTFRKNKEGLVTIEGNLNANSTQYALTIFTLPVGFRPSTTKYLNVGVVDTTVKGDALVVGSGGNVTLGGFVTPIGVAIGVNLNVSFYVD